MKGAELTKVVIKYIEAEGGKVINLIAASKSGNADLIACIGGRYCEFEIKGKGDRIKPAQTLKLNETIRKGGAAAYIHNLDDLKNILADVYQGGQLPLIPINVKKVTL